MHCLGTNLRDSVQTDALIHQFPLSLAHPLAADSIRDRKRCVYSSEVDYNTIKSITRCVCTVRNVLNAIRSDFGIGLIISKRLMIWAEHAQAIDAQNAISLLGPAAPLQFRTSCVAASAPLCHGLLVSDTPHKSRAHCTSR